MHRPCTSSSTSPVEHPRPAAPPGLLRGHLAQRHRLASGCRRWPGGPHHAIEGRQHGLALGGGAASGRPPIALQEGFEPLQCAACSPASTRRVTPSILRHGTMPVSLGQTARLCLAGAPAGPWCRAPTGARPRRWRATTGCGLGRRLRRADRWRSCGQRVRRGLVRPGTRAV